MGDDGGFPSTAAMLAFARANTPPASPNLSKRRLKVELPEDYEDNADDGYYDGEDEYVEEIEVELVEDMDEYHEEADYSSEDEEEEDHHLPQIERRERIDNEKDERMQAARGLAAAALTQRNKLSEAPQIESSYKAQNDSEPRRMVELRSGTDRNQRSAFRSVEPPLSPRSKKYQLYTESGVYIHSSNSLSASSHSSAEVSPPVYNQPNRESIYEQNTSSVWRKKLGALFSWRYPEPKPLEQKSPRRSSWAGDEEKVELDARGYHSDDNICLVSEDFEPLKMFNDDQEDHKKKMARVLASAALFKKDDLAHVEEEDKIKHEPDPNDPKSLQSSLAAAAAVLAAKRKDRLGPMDEEDMDKFYNKQKDEDPADADVTQGSLAAQVAALARKKEKKLKSPEDYDKLYKKPPPEKKEPHLMVQLRPVMKEPSPEEDLSESSEDSAPKLMVQLKPVSRRFEENAPINNLERQQETPVIQTKSVSIEEGKSEDTPYELVTTSKGKLKNYPWPQWGVNRSKETEAYEAFSEASSYASSMTNLDPVVYKEKVNPATGTRRYCLRFVVLLLLLAAIGLPLYFLVFAKDESESDNNVGGIFPPVATPPPSVMPSSTPTMLPSSSPTREPTISPSPTGSTGRPSLRPSPRPTLRPVIATSEPTVPSPSAAPIQPIESLEDFLVSVWPPLEDYLNDPDAQSLPQVQAVEWLNTDPNLGSYSEQQIVQRFTLATFFYSTGGEDWINNEGWLSEESECLWYTSASEFRDPCDSTGNLVNLELNNNGLSGSVPAELALLSESLTRLELSAGNNVDSRLGGTFPPELGRLTLLEYISLNNHEISGTIPTQIGLLSLLTVFDLEGNRFSGTLPATIGQLGQLNNLYMAFNRISGGLPSELGNLSLLVNLDMYGNQLSSTLPRER